MIIGRVTGVDATSGVVQVSVQGSDPLWVPAVPAIYQAGGLVRLLRSPLDGGRISVCVGPVKLLPPTVVGTVVTVGSETLDVKIDQTVLTLPRVSSTYAVGQLVHVLRAGFGAPYMVAGPVSSSTSTPPPSGPSDPGGGQGNGAVTETRESVIGPQWSGSWTGSRWDNWNGNQPAYGGRAALYQGQGYGSPSMQGLAVYGDQIVNLNALSITRMILRLKRPASGSPPGATAVLQGSPNGAGYPPSGPGGTGATFSTGIDRGQTVDVSVPSTLFESFRTGGLKGVALVGSSYLNLYGADTADAMTLRIQYQVRR